MDFSNGDQACEQMVSKSVLSGTESTKGTLNGKLDGSKAM